MSSAYLGALTPSGMRFLRSAMNRMNSVGPRTLPWMTPALTEFQLLVLVGVLTRCLRSLR